MEYTDNDHLLWAVIPACERPLLVIPRTLVKDVVLSVHAPPGGGHLGARKVLGKLTDRYYWKNMLTDVKTVLRACPMCQRVRARRTRVAGTLQPLPAVSYPFVRIAWDVIGPLQTTRTTEYKYILTVTDYLTRYVEAYPLKHNNAEAVATRLLTHICQYGAP